VRQSIQFDPSQRFHAVYAVPSQYAMRVGSPSMGCQPGAAAAGADAGGAFVAKGDAEG
jgi:hypothetical protein